MYFQKLNCYIQNRIIMFCLPVPTLLYLWEIYIFPGSVYLFCCREICGPILGIYKSLTDTWMWKLELRPRNSQKRNTYLGFSLHCTHRLGGKEWGQEERGGHWMIFGVSTRPWLDLQSRAKNRRIRRVSRIHQQLSGELYNKNHEAPPRKPSQMYHDINDNASETKSNESLDNGVFFFIEAK